MEITGKINEKAKVSNLKIYYKNSRRFAISFIKYDIRIEISAQYIQKKAEQVSWIKTWSTKSHT